MSTTDPTSSPSESKETVSVSFELQPDDKTLSLSVIREQLIKALQSDLSSCLSCAEKPNM